MEIERLIRAYQPWPGTYTLLPDGSVLKVHAAKLIEHADACPKPGTIIAADARSGLIVATGTSLLEIAELQAPNGRRLASCDYLKGHSLPIGERLDCH